MSEIKTAKGSNAVRRLEEACSLVDEARFELSRAGTRYAEYSAALQDLGLRMALELEAEDR